MANLGELRAQQDRCGGTILPPRVPARTVSPTAFALIAAAAVAHAAWNFFAKQARGGLPFVWLAGLCATLAYALPAGIQLVLSDDAISAAGVAFMAGSGCLHSIYFTTLQRGYAVGDLSVVYPLARGTGPALSVLAAVVIFGERPGAVALVGAALVVAGVLSLAGGGHRTPTRASLVFALLTGVTIAAYTLWDAHAVQDLAQPALAYYWGSEVTRAFVLAVPALRDREGLRIALAHDRRAILAVGLLSPLAYILVLVALTLAPVSVVAPGREASIVIASLLGTRVLGEGDSRLRALAAVTILAGIACLAVG
jgi:drug/metabolite transporter (DMT)-like permease